MTTVSKRKMIAIALSGLDEDLYRAQLAVRRSAHRFAQFDITGAIGHLTPIDEALNAAMARARTLLEHLASIPAAPHNGSVDPLLATLQAALAALNTSPRFKVPSHDTDSYGIAREIEAYIAQLKEDAA